LAADGVEITGISFADQDRGWAVGALDQKPAIWKTGDGGVSWALQQVWRRRSAPLRGAMLDVSFVDDLHGWAAGFSGSNAIIVATSDGGKNWRTQYSGRKVTGQFSRIQFTDNLRGWALSSDALMQTSDGGKSWHLRRYDPPLLNDIQAFGVSGAWVAGAWGSLLHTPNGIRWSQISLDGLTGDEFFGWVRFVNEQTGWISGTKCNIAMTRDRGKTWVTEACPIPLEPDLEVITGQMIRTNSSLFILCNPKYLLVRQIETNLP
jgi:photosystem II stability/assembly factor-like uncharacterized protein